MRVSIRKAVQTFSLGLLLSAGAALGATLPEGDSGLAAKYPGDAGIGRDPAVVFAENFESGSVANVKRRWEDSGGQMELVADKPQGSAGRASMLMTHVGGKGTGSMLWRRITNKSGGYGYDQLYQRTYVKFDPDCYRLHHFGCNLGGRNPVGPKWPMGNAGKRPNGSDRFNSGPETHSKGWGWDWYNYWCEMRSYENPNGTGSRFFGNDFFAKMKHPVERGKWICVEFMTKLNTPGKRDGEMALWIDGKLVRGGGQIIGHHGPGFPKGHWIRDSWVPKSSDPGFEGIMWRKSADLRINNMSTMVYITKAPAGKVSKVWFDDIVVATEYIGPIATKKRPPKPAKTPGAGNAPPAKPADQGAINEKKAGQLFQMARTAERMGQRSVARNLYMQLAQKYPATESGRRAVAKVK